MITQKLILGDCLEKMKDIPDKSIDLILCDLPYQKISCSWDKMIPFEPLWEQYHRIIKDGGAIVLFGKEPFTSKLICSNIKNFKYKWIWNKKQTGNPFLATKQPLQIYEEIIVFNSKIYYPQMRMGKFRKKGGGKNYKIFGTTTQSLNNLYYPTAILEFPNCKNKSKRLHPTEKPVELLEYIIKTYTKENDLILDNCFGSNSTGVACINKNRNYIGIEKDKKYFQIGFERVSKMIEENNIDCKVVVE